MLEEQLENKEKNNRVVCFLLFGEWSNGRETNDVVEYLQSVCTSPGPLET
jgi:hypothetical protein